MFLFCPEWIHFRLLPVMALSTWFTRAHGPSGRWLLLGGDALSGSRCLSYGSFTPARLKASTRPRGSLSWGKVVLSWVRVSQSEAVPVFPLLPESPLVPTIQYAQLLAGSTCSGSLSPQDGSSSPFSPPPTSLQTRPSGMLMLCQAPSRSPFPLFVFHLSCSRVCVCVARVPPSTS